MQGSPFADAAGVLPKCVDETRLVGAIEDAFLGEPIRDPSTRRGLSGRLRGMNTAVYKRDRKISLSPQEHRVMRLIAEGKTNKEIAADLGLSGHTIRNYLSHIFQKLKISRRSQAAVLFAQFSTQREEAQTTGRTVER